MRPLIVAATREEIAPSLSYLEKKKIPYLITGVGMVATTFALTQYLTGNLSIDSIINIGIAGALNKSLTLGSVVEINRDNFSELGAEDGENYIRIDQLGFGQSSYGSQPLLKKPTALYPCEGITVNTIHGNEESINRLKKHFPTAEVESMEGAAVFFVAEQVQMPCIQIRSISNYVEKRDKSTWKIPLAIENLNTWLISYLDIAY